MPSAGMPSALWIWATLAVLVVAPPVPCANAPPAAIVSEASSTPTPLRPDQRRRRARLAAKRRERDLLADSSHGAWDDRSISGTARNSLWSHHAYGVSCRARAMTCA